jgi:PAS domain S-box-containing protein
MEIFKEPMMYLISALFVVNGLMLIKKAIIKRDLTILGSIISRFLFAITYFLHNTNIFNSVIMIRFSLALVVISDIVRLYVYYKSYKYKVEIENRRLEKSLADLMYKYKVIVDSSPIAMASYNEALILEYANDSLCSLLGYTKEEIVGSHIFKFVYSEDVKQTLQRTKDRFSNKIPIAKYKLNLLRKDGTLLTATIISTRTENGHATVTLSILTETQCDEGG